MQCAYFEIWFHKGKIVYETVYAKSDGSLAKQNFFLQRKWENSTQLIMWNHLHSTDTSFQEGFHSCGNRPLFCPTTDDFTCQVTKFPHIYKYLILWFAKFLKLLVVCTLETSLSARCINSKQATTFSFF